jgi:hypothetical protein
VVFPVVAVALAVAAAVVAPGAKERERGSARVFSTY